METEQQLLKAIHGGDRKAQRRLYDRFAGYAMAVARRYIPTSEEARDVVQDGFVSIFTTIDRFHYTGEGSLKAWVARIMANGAISCLRRQQRLVFTDLPQEDTLGEDDDGNTEEGLDAQIDAPTLTRLIAQLPTGYRLVLNLYVFERRSHRQIAEQLGIQESTSASQLLRARRLLAKMIKEHLIAQRK